MKTETIVTFEKGEWDAICKCYENTLSELSSEKVNSFIEKHNITFDDNEKAIFSTEENEWDDEAWGEYSDLARPVVEIDFDPLTSLYGQKVSNAAFDEWETASNSGYKSNIDYLNKVGAGSLENWDAIKKMTSIVCALGY